MTFCPWEAVKILQTLFKKKQKYIFKNQGEGPKTLEPDFFEIYGIFIGVKYLINFQYSGSGRSLRLSTPSFEPPLKIVISN